MQSPNLGNNTAAAPKHTCKHTTTAGTSGGLWQKQTVPSSPIILNGHHLQQGLGGSLLSSPLLLVGYQSPTASGVGEIITFMMVACVQAGQTGGEGTATMMEKTNSTCTDMPQYSLCMHARAMVAQAQQCCNGGSLTAVIQGAEDALHPLWAAAHNNNMHACVSERDNE